MAYNAEKLTKLSALQALAQRSEAAYAKKTELEELKTTVEGIVEAGGEANVIEGISVNGTAATITDKVAAITVPTKTSDLTNDSDYQTGDEVSAAINSKVSSTYKAGGSVAFASLPELTEANLGLVVNVTDDFTTTADFVEGAGKKHTSGTNVAVVLSDGDYKYDVLSGFVDLSGYATTESVESGLSKKVDTDDIATDAEVTEMLDEIYGT